MAVDLGFDCVFGNSGLKCYPLIPKPLAAQAVNHPFLLTGHRSSSNRRKPVTSSYAWEKAQPCDSCVDLAFSHICVEKEQAPTAKKDRRQGDNPNRRRIGL